MRTVTPPDQRPDRTRRPAPRSGPRRPDQRPDRPPRRRRRVRATQPADTVWKGTVVALVVFVVLASGNMKSSAEGMPLGWQRSLTVAATSVIDRVANALSLNRPYDWAAGALGIAEDDSDFEFPEVQVDETPSATTTTLPPVRVPSAAAPLDVVVAGDSTAKSLGDALIGAITDLPELAVTNEGRVSTGLARSDYFNWGAGMAKISESDEPEVTVFMVGANDGQAILDGDGTIVARFDTPEWETAYRERIAGIMDLNHVDGRRLIWVGEPNVGTANVARAVTLGNAMAEEEAGKRPWVTYLDTAAIVAGPDGQFSEYVTMPDGSTARCYAGDGVHLSVKCLGLVIDELVPTITDLYSETGSPEPSTDTTAAPSSGSG